MSVVRGKGQYIQTLHRILSDSMNRCRPPKGKGHLFVDFPQRANKHMCIAILSCQAHSYCIREQQMNTLIIQLITTFVIIPTPFAMRSIYSASQESICRIARSNTNPCHVSLPPFPIQIQFQCSRKGHWKLLRRFNLSISITMTRDQGSLKV